MTKKRRLRRFALLSESNSLIKFAYGCVSNLQAVSINEFLKPAQGENYYRGGGRGGRGRGGRVSSGGYGSNRSETAPAIADTAQFPSLGGK